MRYSALRRVADDISATTLEWAVCTPPAIRGRALTLYSCEAINRRGFSFDALSPQTRYELRTLIDEHAVIGFIEMQDYLIEVYAAENNISERSIRISPTI